MTPKCNSQRKVEIIYIVHDHNNLTAVFCIEFPFPANAQRYKHQVINTTCVDT